MAKHWLGALGAIGVVIGGLLGLIPGALSPLSVALILIGLVLLVYDGAAILRAIKISGTPLRWFLLPGIEVRDVGAGLLKQADTPVKVTRFGANLTNRLRRPINNLSGVVELSETGEVLPLTVHASNAESKPVDQIRRIDVGAEFTVEYAYDPGGSGGVDWEAFSTVRNDVLFKLKANGKSVKIRLTFDQIQQHHDSWFLAPKTPTIE